MYQKLQRGTYIVNYYEGEELPYYVQEVALLDHGRFTTLKAAEELKEYLENQKETP